VVLTGETPLHSRLFSRQGSLREEVATVAGSQLDRVCLEDVIVETSDPERADRQPVADGRALALLEAEFARLEATASETLLDETPDLKRLFDDLLVLDSVQPGRRDELQTAEAWSALITQARELLAAELDGSILRGEDPS